MAVTFEVRGERFEMPDDYATITAEELRRRAAGHFGETRGMAGSLELANEIELRLVGERDDPVALDDVRAISLFHYLNIVGKPGDPLYRALRAVHDASVADM
jgi:hypothetical protein